MDKTMEIFKKEWAMHREGGAQGPFTADTARAGGDFDPDPKEGEIRIFADMRRPFVALLAERRGAAGWLIVPASPFTVPASWDAPPTTISPAPVAVMNRAATLAPASVSVLPSTTLNLIA